MGNLILIVEDQEDNRRILRDLLQANDFGIVEATNGLEGVELAASHRPDLILMDIQLPGIDGYEATRQIKAQQDLHHIPIIVITSYALSGDDLKAYEAGCDDYMAKPFSPRNLLKKIKHYLEPTESQGSER